MTVDAPASNQDGALAFLDAEKARIELDARLRFPDLARGLIERMAAVRPIRVLEIGAGRSPLFDPATLPAGVTYVIQDVIAEELELCPYAVERACFDACGPVPDLAPVDLVLSRMVAEHLPDAAGFYRLQAAVMTPGALYLHLHPTLFAFPFLLNYMLPSAVAEWIVETLYPHRRADGQEPVFPAHYNWCTGLERELDRRRALGFDRAERIRLFRHGYYVGLPPLDRLQRRWAAFACAQNWNLFTAYAVDYGRRAAR